MEKEKLTNDQLNLIKSFMPIVTAVLSSNKHEFNIGFEIAKRFNPSFAYVTKSEFLECLLSLTGNDQRFIEHIKNEFK